MTDNKLYAVIHILKKRKVDIDFSLFCIAGEIFCLVGAFSPLPTAFPECFSQSSFN